MTPGRVPVDLSGWESSRGRGEDGNVGGAVCFLKLKRLVSLIQYGKV